MKLDTLWSMTTTIREAERIPAFLKTAKEIENEEWNTDTQIRSPCCRDEQMGHNKIPYEIFSDV